MKRLKDKAHAQSSDWAYAFEHIEEFITKKEVEDIFDKTVEFVSKTIVGHKPGFGWSGGKESIVLADIMREAGVVDCCLAYNTDMDYSSFIKWADDNKPKGCIVYDRADDFNFTKMAKSGMEAFSEDSNDYNRYMDLGHRKAFISYCESHGLDMFIMGRRKADNNVCGKAPSYITSCKNRSYVSFSPMAEWTTEQVLGYIRYFKGGYNVLPPQYSYVDGWYYGSDAPIYSKLRGMTRQQMWARLYQNDSSLVMRAAQHLESAKQFLKSIG